MGDDFRTDNDKLRGAGTRASIVTAVVLFGTAKGVPLSELERVTGLSLSDLVDPEARVPDASLGAAWTLIGRACPDAAPALEMAAAAPLSMFGPFAQAARFAASRYAALEIFARYQKILSGGLEMRLEGAGEELKLVLSHSQDALDGGHGAEAALGLGARMGREILGMQDAVRRVELAHGPHGPADAYERWFANPVVFNSRQNAVVFSRDALDLPPKQPDPAMYQYIEAHLQLVQQRLVEQSKDGPLDRLRASIAELARKSEYGAEALARSQGMSLRTLQRFAAKHGSSVRELIDEVREANARDLLADDRLGIEEVAFLVGYSDDRAFRRAFRRWTGVSPAAFREEQRHSVNVPRTPRAGST